MPVEAAHMPVEAANMPVEAANMLVEATDMLVEAANMLDEAADMPVEALDHLGHSNCIHILIAKMSVLELRYKYKNFDKITQIRRA